MFPLLQKRGVKQNMEKCEHAQLQPVKQLGGPTLIMCTGGD